MRHRLRVHSSFSNKTIRQCDGVIATSCDIPLRLTVARYLLDGRKKARVENLNAGNMAFENMDCAQFLEIFSKVDYPSLSEFSDGTDPRDHKGQEKRRTFNFCKFDFGRRFLHRKKVCSEHKCNNSVEKPAPNLTALKSFLRKFETTGLICPKLQKERKVRTLVSGF